jgi:hypothetical protein
VRAFSRLENPLNPNDNLLGGINVAAEVQEQHTLGTKELGLLDSNAHTSDIVTLLAGQAHTRLLEVLQDRNAVSPAHSRATQQMMSGMAAQAVGADPGRYAYGIPCGGGKTQGVIALIAAAQKLDLGLTFAVATSQIEALCGIKRDLIDAGIRAENVGLMHGYKWRPERELCGPGTGCASEPATPTDREYPILLLSHAKIQHGHTATYRGQPRSLLIWDESLLTTNARSMAVKDIRRVLAICKVDRPDLTPFIQKVLDQVEAELEYLSADERHRSRMLLNLLPHSEIDEARRLASTTSNRGDYGRLLAEDVLNMLALIEQPVSVVSTGNGDSGDGFLRYEVTVADHLKNIAILDASHILRDLTKADTSIKDRTSTDMLSYKSYSAVTARQVKLSTGKSTLAAKPEASLAAAREVQRVIDAAPAGECVLVFTFKDVVRHLEKNLDKLGVNRAEQVSIDGVLRKRIEILTWGQETSRNDLLHCRHVVMVGVLRRNPLDLAAALTGQQRSGNSPQRHSTDTLSRLNLSEMAHCVLQGMNRGCCRVMDSDGKARAMTLTILVNGVCGLYDMLKPVLTGIQWEQSEPQGKALSRTAQSARRIAEYLRNLVAPKVSVSSLSKALNISLGKDAMREAVDAALLIGLPSQRWRRDARSLIRD